MPKQNFYVDATKLDHTDWFEEKNISYKSEKDDYTIQCPYGWYQQQHSEKYKKDSTDFSDSTFHKHFDQNKSCWVSGKHGGFKCRICKKSGNFIQLLAIYSGFAPEDKNGYRYVLGEIDPTTRTRKIIHTKTIDNYHKALLTAHEKLTEYNEIAKAAGISIEEGKGISFLTLISKKYFIPLEQIKRRRYGYRMGRIVIPVEDIDQLNVFNALYHHPAPAVGEKKSFCDKGYSTKIFYRPWDLKYPTIAIFEGPLKAEAASIYLNKLNIGCISAILGNNWPPQFGKQFTTKHIFYIRDMDAAGKVLGYEEVFSNLSNYAASYHIIETPEGKDIHDWMRFEKFEVEPNEKQFKEQLAKFENLLRSPIEPPPVEADYIEPDENRKCKECTIQEAFNVDKMGKLITFKARILVMKNNPYLIPDKVRFTCKEYDSSECKKCIARRKKEAESIEEDGIEVRLDTTSPELLSLIDNRSKKEIEEDAILRSINIFKCKNTKIDILSHTHIYDVWIIPEKELGQPEIIEKMLYVTSPASLRISGIYQFYGRMIEHPKSHLSIFAASKVERLKQQIEEADITDEQLAEAAKNFKVKTDNLKGLDEIIEQNIDDFSRGETKVYNSFDLHLAKLLCWHSITTKFDFGGSLKWGLIDCAIIGDSGIAKTQVSENIIESYKFGDILDTTNPTLPGLLIGRNKKENGQIYQQYGKFILNDKQTIVLEEFGTVLENPQKMMTGIGTTRSSFYVSDSKIGDVGKKIPARCSKIFERNPKKHSSTQSYPHGILAILELAKVASDLRRFDFVLILSKEDADGYEKEEAKYTDYKSKISNESRQVCLIQVKRLKTNDLIFEEGFMQHCKELGRALSVQFSNKITICQMNTMAEKLARLAIALAALVFNYNEDGKLVIKKYHVEYIRDWLLKIYTKPSCDFNGYSNYEKEEEFLINEEEVKSYFTETRYPRNFINILLSKSKFTRNHLLELIRGMDSLQNRIDNFYAEKQLSMLVANRAIKVNNYNQCSCSSALIKLLKELRKEDLKEKNIRTNINEPF